MSDAHVTEPGSTAHSHETPAGFRWASHPHPGGEVRFLLGGDGPPLVLLHGWPQTSAAWTQVAPALAAAGHTVIAPDLPGLGWSDPLKEGYGKEAQARALREVVQEIGLGHPLRVVGHDIGGMVAFAWARIFPDEVARLALVDLGVPGLGLEEAMDMARGGRWHLGFFLTPEIPEMLISGSEDEFFEWWFRSLAGNHAAFPPAHTAKTTATYRGREALRRTFGHYRTLLEDGRTNRAWLEGGGRLSMPVAGIGGALSLGGRVAQSLVPVARDVQEIIIHGAGHFPAEEQAAEFTRKLVAFLADY